MGWERCIIFFNLSKFWTLPKRGLSFGQNGHESYWAEFSPNEGQFAFAVSVVSSVIALRWNFFSCCGLLQVCCERFRFLRDLSHCMKFFNFVKVLGFSKKGSKHSAKIVMKAIETSCDLMRSSLHLVLHLVFFCN